MKKNQIRKSVAALAMAVVVDTGENWRTDTEMIPKHDNLIGG